MKKKRKSLLPLSVRFVRFFVPIPILHIYDALWQKKKNIQGEDTISLHYKYCRSVCVKREWKLTFATPLYSSFTVAVCEFLFVFFFFSHRQKGDGNSSSSSSCVWTVFRTKYKFREERSKRTTKKTKCARKAKERWDDDDDVLRNPFSSTRVSPCGERIISQNGGESRRRSFLKKGKNFSTQTKRLRENL